MLCRFGKEICAIELKEPEFLTISRTSRIVLLFHQLVTCEKTFSCSAISISTYCQGITTFRNKDLARFWFSF